MVTVFHNDRDIFEGFFLVQWPMNQWTDFHGLWQSHLSVLAPIEKTVLERIA